MSEQEQTELLAIDIRRKLAGRMKYIVAASATLTTLISVYSFIVRPIDPIILRSTHVFLVSITIFSLCTGTRRAPRNRATLFDYLWILLSASVWVYLMIDGQNLIFREGADPTRLDILFGSIIFIVVVEMARRTSGLALPILVLVLFVYTLYGNFLPGLLQHKGYSLSMTISSLFGMLGIYGVPIGISVTIAILFVMFGIFLEFAGGSRFFVDLAQTVTGGLRAGPAKMSIFSSALFGTISGSAVSNVVVDGVFTIPLMRKIGLSPVVASAVEAVASTGGQIMPPVMGAAAFVMAEFTGVPYNKIVVTAIIPALLYYISLYVMIDLEAQRTGITKLMDRSGMRTFNEIMRRDWFLIIPIVTLIYTLMGLMMSPNRCALIATLALVIVSWVRADTRMNFKRISGALEKTGRSIIDVTATCACAGMAIGLISTTGLGLRLGSTLLTLSGNNLPVALFLTMILVLVLGMGMPTVAAYAVAQAVAVPLLVELGVDSYVANFFVFYYACISAITPPVALAAYAAAALSGSSAMRVGFAAVKLGIIGFIVPYMCVYGPELLMVKGTVLEIIWTVISACVGVFALAAGVQGWTTRRINIVQRLMYLVAAILLIDPGLLTDCIGAVLIAAALLWQRMSGWAGQATAVTDTKP